MKNRIRELREERGLKQVDLANELGVRQNTLSTWETGRYEPDNEMLRKIAEHFQVSVDYILGKSPVRNFPTTQIDTLRMIRLVRTVEQMDQEQFDETLTRAENILTGQVDQGVGVHKIPVLGSVPAGIPIEAIEDVLDWEEIPASMCNGDKEYFALKVQGDSMWPDYLPGDIVIVRKSPVCENGNVCVVYINGYDATLKQVTFQGDGSLTIVPRNPSYPPRTFSREEVRDLPVSVAGVVVELRRKVK